MKIPSLAKRCRDSNHVTVMMPVKIQASEWDECKEVDDGEERGSEFGSSKASAPDRGGILHIRSSTEATLAESGKKFSRPAGSDI